ncbi:MAG: hypothetical protein PHD55_00005, partial [Methanoregula sp.]|nr:hypothetical protein [Methanoregula sp.]
MPKSASNRQIRIWTSILLFITVGMAVFLISPVSAEKPVVIIVAHGAGSYYLGEEAFFSGMNMDSDTTYLHITGPNLPDSGGKLTSPSQKAVSGDPGTFTIVKTNPDKTWEYSWFTVGLRLDAGSYTVYATSKPKTEEQLADTPYGTTSIIIKKPFITANISSLQVVKGQPFTITGIAEGIPPNVQIWIFGDNYAFNTTTPVNSDASFTFTGDATMSGKLPKGQNYLIVQHPMADNQFDIVVSGDYARNLKLNSGTNLFKITGPGSLQGSDAADALIFAINDHEAQDGTLTNDTYTIIPFQVADAGSPTVAPASGASTGTAVTISADGSHSYYQGEKVVLRGQSPTAGTVYLFMTGPKLPANGGSLTSPYQAIVSGNPNSFTTVTTKPDKTWEYFFYTDNLNLDAGTYTVYAESQPKAADQLDSGAADVGMALKKPYITANISSLNVVKGQQFTVTGIAEGIPPEVQVWIFGNNYAFTTKTPVNSDGDFTFTAGAAMSGNLPAGQYYLVVQHPMADNQFDFVIKGAYVRDLKLNNGTDLFKISGPGNLQGSDAADALITSITAQNANDDSYTNDTYTLIPFQVTAGAGSASAAGSGVTISADGVKSYYLGEKVVLRGQNTDSDTTYLFISGPDTFKNGPGIPSNGGKLTSPLQEAVSGDPDTFTIVKTKPDKTWEYAFYTANLPVDAGTYNVYAVSQPKALDQAGPAAAGDGIILKKPYITASISPSSVSGGQPFRVTGTAVGNISAVQVWIFGDNYAFTTKTPVNSNGDFTFTAGEAMSENLPAGQYY